MEQESGFAFQQNRKAKWPPPTIRREALVAFERKLNPSARRLSANKNSGYEASRPSQP